MSFMAYSVFLYFSTFLGMKEEMPPKLQSLRGSSLARRLEAEARRRQPRQRPPTALSPGKPKLSKYRRKCANAKVRFSYILSL